MKMTKGPSTDCGSRDALGPARITSGAKALAALTALLSFAVVACSSNSQTGSPTTISNPDDVNPETTLDSSATASVPTTTASVPATTRAATAPSAVVSGARCGLVGAAFC